MMAPRTDTRRVTVNGPAGAAAGLFPRVLRAAGLRRVVGKQVRVISQLHTDRRELRLDLS